MAIVDYLYFVFKTDGSEVKKGADEAKKATDKLQESMRATEIVSNKLGHSFKELVHHAAGGLLALASAGALVHGIHAAREYTERIGDLSETLNVNIEDLSAWSDAVAINGGTAEDFQQTVRNMTGSLQDMVSKGHSRAEPFFKQLGISMTDAQGKARDFFSVLPEIAGAFEKISKTESYGIGQGLGLDNGTILLLQKGRREVEEIIRVQHGLGVITEKDAAAIRKFNDAWSVLVHGFRTLFVHINSFILPALTKVIETFGKLFDYFSRHPHLLTGAIIALGAAITTFLLPPLVRTAIAALATVWPFLLIAAVIAALGTAFALVYEDIQVFREGGNSLIGEFVQKWPKLSAVIMGVAKAIRILWDIFVGFLALFIQSFVDPIQAAKNFNAVVVKAFEELLDTFPVLKKAIDAIGHAFSKMGKVVEGVWDSIISAIKVAVDFVMRAVDKVWATFGKVKSALGFGGKDTEAMTSTGKEMLSLASTSPISSQTSNSILTSNKSSDRSTSVQTGDITIQTKAVDAEGIAASFGQSMKEQMRQAINNFDDGVAA